MVARWVTCANGQNFDARSHVFRPLDDRFVRGDGRSGRPIDQRAIFAIRTIQWRE
jgi:hypothetical protein